MNFKKNNINAFTLIEILVSLTILSIIMVSVMFVFVNSTNLSAKTEINRVMQENIKNVVETISEDIRKNWIFWLSDITWVNCNDIKNQNNTPINANNYFDWSKLCTTQIINDHRYIKNVYYLAKDDIGWTIRIDDSSSCRGLNDSCYIRTNNDRLTNSSVAVKDLQFYVTDDYIPKVTMTIVMQPSSKKWVKSSIIEENKIVIQTTISEKTF